MSLAKINFSFKNRWGEYKTTAYYKFTFIKAPVVVFSHGLGATKDMYTWLIGPLILNGFVVVMFNVPQGWLNTFKLFLKMLFWKVYRFVGNELHPFENIELPSIQQWSDGIIHCISFLEKLKKLTNIIDLERVFCMGHSAGGLGSLLAARDDVRIKKVVAFAPPLLKEEKALPYPQPELKIPVQIQCGTKDSLVKGDQKFYSHLISPKKELILIKGGDHIQYLDRWIVLFTKMVTKVFNIPFIRTHASISLMQQHQISQSAFLEWFKD